MNKYLLYTTQGYCEDPNGEEIDNCQYLGRVAARDEDEAVEKFFNEHPWVSDSGYTKSGVIVAQLHGGEDIY